MPRFVVITASLVIASAVFAAAQQKAPDEAAAETQLLAAAEESKDAYLALRSTRVGLTEDNLVVHRGFFISAEGLAVVPLQAFDHGPFEAIVETQQAPLRITGVVAADTATGLAIVRTDHRPAKWLALRAEDLAVDARVSIYRRETDGGCVAAPVLARRKVAAARSRVYNEVFSLGVNLGELGATQVPAGTPVLDSAGEAAGILSAPSFTTGQRFLFAYPASGIRAQLPPNPGNSATIPFPLPKSFQPADPLALDATYLLGRRHQLTGNLPDAERLLRKALARQPKSASGWERLGFVLRGLNRDDDALAAFEKAAELSGGLPAFILNQADQLRLMNRLNEATKLLEAACAAVPHDYELRRALAVALQIRKDEAAAEKHLRAAVKLAPDVMSNRELLSKCLVAQGKWDEEKAVSERIYELDSLYRPR